MLAENIVYIFYLLYIESAYKARFRFIGEDGEVSNPEMLDFVTTSDNF